MADEVVEVADDPGWTLRRYDPEAYPDDERGMMYLLGVSYSRSRAGWRAGAAGAGGNDVKTGTVDAQRAFLSAHEPIWQWLLTHADVTLAVDPAAPEDIWGWLVTSEPNIIHAVGVKYSVCRAGLAQELAESMLGGRLREHAVATLELPQMRDRGPGARIFDRPSTWSLDPTWLLTRMVGR
jgi:hypothetical protein